jgi:membrane associated rhomboid family serine protease
VRTEGTQKVIPRERLMSRTGGAPATKTFIALAVIFYVLGAVGLRGDLLEALAQANFLVAEGQWYRIFTPVLLHAPQLYHILFNMWALWVLGPQIERGVGTWPFVGAFLASAGVGGAFMYVLGHPEAVTVGASGAIFGLFGIWMNWAVRRRNTAFGRVLLRQIGFLLALNAALPFIIPAIAWEAHLGGLIAGFVIGELWSRARNEMARVAVTVAIAGLAIVAVLVL